MNRNIIQEEIQMTRRLVKKIFASLIIWDLQIKTTMRASQSTENGTHHKEHQCWHGCMKKGTLINCW